MCVVPNHWSDLVVLLLRLPVSSSELLMLCFLRSLQSVFRSVVGFGVDGIMYFEPSMRRAADVLGLPDAQRVEDQLKSKHWHSLVFLTSRYWHSGEEPKR